MAQFDLSDLMNAPAWRRMIEREAKRAQKVAEAWDEMFDQFNRAVTPADIISARERHAVQDYPPTAFGTWLQEEDEKMLSSEPC